MGQVFRARDGKRFDLEPVLHYIASPHAKEHTGRFSRMSIIQCDCPRGSVPQARVIPKYPPDTGKLYTRVAMPSILSTDFWSVAVYAGGGSDLAKQIRGLITNRDLNEKL